MAIEWISNVGDWAISLVIVIGTIAVSTVTGITLFGLLRQTLLQKETAAD